MQQQRINTIRYMSVALFFILVVIATNKSAPPDKELPANYYAPVFPVLRFYTSNSTLFIIPKDNRSGIPFRSRKFKIIEYASIDDINFFVVDSTYTKDDIYIKIK